MNPNSSGAGAVANVSPKEAQARQQAGAIILDVREPDEWADGHIAGATHIPLGSLGQRIAELDPSQEIIAVCHSGVRSTSAVRALQRIGFTQVKNLAGGMLAWVQDRLPVSK
ncbi:MAG TPA: rhodanese-like domain-containing protein [Ktedonobacterales bacterium]|jgi:rhodanese-related sulfurtransferase|nr:rhodanese-like domain-containing protein [Ktedonobacterales bacterium]